MNRISLKKVMAAAAISGALGFVGIGVGAGVANADDGYGPWGPWWGPWHGGGENWGPWRGGGENWGPWWEPWRGGGEDWGRGGIYQ
jgi:hypothetical protein